MALTVTGVHGCLRWGYHQAGTVTDWTIATENGVRTLTATVGSVDMFRARQRPIMFVAPHAAGAWRWPVVTLHIQDGSLTATLGPLE